MLQALFKLVMALPNWRQRRIGADKLVKNQNIKKPATFGCCGLRKFLINLVVLARRHFERPVFQELVQFLILLGMCPGPGIVSSEVFRRAK